MAHMGMGMGVGMEVLRVDWCPVGERVGMG